MAEVSGYVPGPYQGISQAPPQVRLAGTCDFMEDCLAVLPMGIQKRPPLTLLASLGLTGDAPTTSLVQEIPGATRADDVTLVLIKQSGVVVPKLFNSTTLAPIAISIDATASTYLSANSPSPGLDLKVRTVEDVTFIANSTVGVAANTTPNTARPFEALVFVKTGGYSRTFSVTVSPVSGTPVQAIYATSTGASAEDVIATGTDKIAQGLYDGTDPAPGHDTIGGTPLATLGDQGFTVSQVGATIYIAHPSTDFTVVTSDDQGGTGMVAIKGSVQRFSDLPAVAYPGFTVKVAQAAAGSNSDYFVQWQPDLSGSNVGVWQECVEPGSPLGYTTTSMPVGITNTAGTWALVTLPWKNRTVGNATLCPDPTFVGSKVTDVGWWKGRLAICSPDAVLLSGSDSPYRVYPTTLAASLDSDPIELLAPANRKAYFREMTTFDQRFIAWGDEAQAIISSTSKAVSPSNTGIDPLGEAPYAYQCRVQESNHRAYYLALRTTSAVIYELSVDRISGQILPEDMTAAVPALLPSTIDRSATSKTEYLTVYGSHGSTTLYVHNYRYSQQQNVQNAFSKWNLPYPLVGMFFRLATQLMVFMNHPSGTILAASLDIAPLRTDPSGTFLSHLDLRCTEADCTISYSAALDRTTITPPAWYSGLTYAPMLIQRATGAGIVGYTPTVAVAWDGTKIIYQGDLRTQKFWFGLPYLSQFKPTRTYKLGQDQRPELSGTLNLKKYRLDLADVGYLRILVNISGRAPQTLTFEGRLQNSEYTALDATSLIPETVLEVPLGAPNRQVSVTFQNDSPLGFKLLGYEWEGDYTPRAQRTT